MVTIQTTAGQITAQTSSITDFVDMNAEALKVQLEQEGFVVVDLLDSQRAYELINRLQKSVYQEKGFFNPVRRVVLIERLAGNTILSGLDELCCDYIPAKVSELTGISLTWDWQYNIVRKNGSSGEHRDVADYTVWINLEPNTGLLYVYPKSHNPNYNDLNRNTSGRTIISPMEAGQAVILNGLLHNTTFAKQPERNLRLVSFYSLQE